MSEQLVCSDLPRKGFCMFGELLDLNASSNNVSDFSRFYGIAIEPSVAGKQECLQGVPVKLDSRAMRDLCTRLPDLGKLLRDQREPVLQWLKDRYL